MTMFGKQTKRNGSNGQRSLKNTTLTIKCLMEKLSSPHLIPLECNTSKSSCLPTNITLCVLDLLELVRLLTFKSYLLLCCLRSISTFQSLSPPRPPQIKPKKLLMRNSRKEEKEFTVHQQVKDSLSLLTI